MVTTQWMADNLIYNTIDKPDFLSDEQLDRMLIFAIDYLKLPDIILTIDFCDLDADVFGFFDCYDNDSITIEISNKLTLDEISVTIFHELIHASQFIRGDLILESPLRWCGSDSSLSDGIDFPWEIEAYLTERKMLDLYNEQMGVK